jgi:alanine dehydrogenase
MIIGIPKESFHDEQRVALTPAGSYALVKQGHQVIVQADAGLGCGYSNESYQEARATIAYSVDEIFGRADLIVKVQQPSAQEVRLLADGKTLFSFFQFGVTSADTLQRLGDKRCNAIGYNLIEDDAGNLPVLMTMSEIAGMMLPQIAGRYLETREGGRGILLGGVAGIPAANVVIIGAGVVGSKAAQAFVGAGADVLVMDNDLSRLRQLELQTSRTVNTAIATPYNIERYIQFADVLVGAAMIHGQQSPHVVSEAQVNRMRPGSVVLDISIDQGGCIETSRPTTHSDPIFVRNGVIHYAVPNIPALVARTASNALNNVILPFAQLVAHREGQAFVENDTLKRGIYLYRGQCTQPELAKMFNRPSFSIDNLLRND